MRFIKGIFAGLTTLAGVNAASLQQVPNFGDNPSGARMYIYVPDNVSSNPAVIVAIHWCTGTAQAYYGSTPYAQLADQHGFIVVYPESPYDGGCWDVSSPASLRRGGGGSSNAIANMVTYTLQRYNGNKEKVFATGTSSGGMMTNVLCATYPDMFAAASSYSGVAAGCFYTGTVAGWNNTCSQGQEIHSQAVRRDIALAMYPGYNGPRPRIQIYHGSADDIILPQNWNEAVKQWTGVFGYPETPMQTDRGVPGQQYTRYTYGDNVQGIYGEGVGHSVPVFGEEDLRWFGIIDGGNPDPEPTPTSSSTTLSTSTRTSTQTPTKSPGEPEQTRWGQCGGIGWQGPANCQSPWTCTKLNDWYFQCL